jgi:hypothetical protein
MAKIIALKNDIKNYLNKIDTSLYYDIEEKDVQVIHDLFFNQLIPTMSSVYDKISGKFKPEYENNAMVNYYYGVYCELDYEQYMDKFQYYIKSAELNNVGAMFQLVRIFKGSGDYVNEYIYRIILNNTKNTLLSYWDYLKIDFGMSFLTYHESLRVYKDVGNYYARQHNYDFMLKYYTLADQMQKFVDLYFNIKPEKNTPNFNDSSFYLAKKYTKDPEDLNVIAKYYGVIDTEAQPIQYDSRNLNTLLGQNAYHK